MHGEANRTAGLRQRVQSRTLLPLRLAHAALARDTILHGQLPHTPNTIAPQITVYTTTMMARSHGFICLVLQIFDGDRSWRR